MRFRLSMLIFFQTAAVLAAAEVDVEAFGKSLGGWDGKKEKLAEYEISVAKYRTYKPEVSPSPDGGIFVSLRIDHLRGLLASDDHASLEMTFSADGLLVTAQSSIALQGITIRKMTSGCKNLTIYLGVFPASRGGSIRFPTDSPQAI